MQIDVASILALGLLVALIFLAWRGSRQNPAVDRALVNELGKVKNRVTKIEADMAGCATKVDIAALTGKIEALEEHAASAGDLLALQGQIHVIEERVAGVKETVDDVRDSVKVIERLLMSGRLDK